jgi:hypothetical protein
VPSFKRGDARNRRVQGIDKDIGDLVLKGGDRLPVGIGKGGDLQRHGKKVFVKVGGAILPAPTLKRGMGNSSIELTVHDPKLRWLKLGLSSEKWDAEIDGLWFRYLGTSKQGKQLTLRFEDRDVARLRELVGPKKEYAHRGQKNELTRAEFIVGLVRELKGPKLKIVCPELHEKQPIASREKGEEAKDKAREERGKGIGDESGLTVKGDKADPEQREIVDRALRVAEHRNAPFRVQVALLTGLIAESECRNLGGGHGTSKGVLQVIDTTAAEGGFDPKDVEASVDGFLTGYINDKGGALAYYKANPGASAAKIAAEVQRNRDGVSSYAPWEDEAREWVETFDGAGGPAGEEVTEPITFQVGKKESYWQAIQRLAKEVNWRAFITNGTFYYVSEPELLRAQVRLAIELDEEGRYLPVGIEEVDFDFNLNKPATSATVTAFVKEWGAPPGSVVTLGGFGPASIGFGSAPVKADEKGRRLGLSSNRKAKTGEGKGRFLVSSIETPLTGDAEARLASIEVRKPTAPLPEPRPETRTVSAGAGDAVDALDGVRITSTSSGSPYWGGTAALFKQFFTPFLEERGLKAGSAKEQRPGNPDSDHDVDNALAYAIDFPTSSGEGAARALAEAIGWPDWQPNSYGSKVIEVDGHRIEIQILWGSGIDHGDHVHVGADSA